MKMRKLFSSSFYKDTLLRIRGMSIVLTVLSCAFAALKCAPYLLSYLSSLVSHGNSESYMSPVTLIDVNSFMTTFSCIIVPIMTGKALGFLFKRNEADFYDALPISRSTMMTSALLAVATCSAFALAASSVVSILVLAPCFGKTVYFIFGMSMLQLLSLLLCILLSAAAASLACAVTGTSGAATFTAAVIIAAPRLLLLLINNAIYNLGDGAVKGEVIPLFDNNYNLVTAFLFGDKNTASSNPFAYLYTVLLTAALAFLAVVIYSRRKSEAATHPFANSIARHFVAITSSLIISAGAMVLFCIEGYLIGLSVFLFLLSLAAYFIIELAFGKKEKKLVKALKVLPIFLAVNFVIGAFIGLGGAVFNSYEPEAEDIDYVSVVQPEASFVGYYDFEQYVALKSDSIRLRDEEIRSIVSEAFGRDPDDLTPGEEWYENVVFKIKARGRARYRALNLYPAEYEKVSNRLCAVEEFREVWMNVSEGAMNPSVYHGDYDLEGEAGERVLATLQAEINEIGFDEWFERYRFGDYETNINYTAIHNGKAVTVSLRIPTSMTKTVAVLEHERLNKANALLEELRALVAKASGGGDLYISADLFSVKNYYGVYLDFSDNRARAEEFANELLGMISIDVINYDKPYVSLKIGGSSVFSSDYTYASFAFRDDLGEEDIVSFFKKYES